MRGPGVLWHYRRLLNYTEHADNKAITWQNDFLCVVSGPLIAGDVTAHSHNSWVISFIILPCLLQATWNMVRISAAGEFTKSFLPFYVLLGVFRIGWMVWKLHQTGYVDRTRHDVLWDTLFSMPKSLFLFLYNKTN